jgi:hypothetical protein
MLMEGAALPIDAMLEPKRPSAVLEPSPTHMRSQVPVAPIDAVSTAARCRTKVPPSTDL